LNDYEQKCDESHEMRDTPTRESVGEEVIHAPPMVDTPQKIIKNQNIILNKSIKIEKDEDAQDDDMRSLSEENEDKETEYFCATPDFMEGLEPNDIYLGEGKMAMVKTTMMPSITHEYIHDGHECTRKQSLPHERTWDDHEPGPDDDATQLVWNTTTPTATPTPTSEF